MDTQNKHTTVTRMDLPRSESAVFEIVCCTVVVVFVAVAISNLVDYAWVPLYAIILSVVWLLWVATFSIVGFTLNIREAGGLRPFIINFLAMLSAHHFVEIIPQHGDDLAVRFRFTLLGHHFINLQIHRTELASVTWRSGQATSLAFGEDMNDWQVHVLYDCKARKRTSVSDYRAAHIVGPPGPKHEAAALGGSLVDFFHSAGIELHPTKDESGFTTRKQDEAVAES